MLTLISKMYRIFLRKRHFVVINFVVIIMLNNVAKWRFLLLSPIFISL
ncbi:hypothetical protein HMPREF1584_00696 [Gardnerella vaginalis JCP8481A]|nr:hypothetical protein HMPREF1584_00696 [Gardnerella vaginalis JCP8481A]EPI43607.1 hypothetical protein HMPREF1585_00421 [Gardnerella vaginalis JCP8481B]